MSFKVFSLRGTFFFFRRNFSKLIALVVYILLGMLALKPRFAKPVRLGFGALALLVFAYIVSVALARQAWPW